MIDTVALREKVLDLAIRGKLVPQDPGDEPASVLLERIRAQKQQMVKEGKLKAKDIKDDSVIFKGEDNLHYEKFADGTVKCIEDEIPFELPSSWNWCRLGVLFAHNTGKALNSSDTTGTRLTYITTSNLYWDRFELDSLKEMPFTESEIEKCTVRKGDLLVCEGGDIGRSAIWLLDEEIRIQNHIHRLRSYIELSNRFYYYVMYLWKRMDRIGGQGIGLQGFSSKALHKLIVPLPPVNEQFAVVEKLDSILGSVDDLDELNAEFTVDVECIKKQILDLAIRGKLVPQNPDDEPASVLLERIRAEKEELIRQGKIKRDKKESVIFKGEDNSYYEKIGEKVICIDDELPFEIPESWSWTRFGNIVFNYDSQRRPITKHNRVNDLGLYDYYGATGAIDKVDSYIFDGEYLMIGEDGGNFFTQRDNSFIASGRFWANNHVHIVQPVVCDIWYLKHFLDSCDLALMGLITGIGVPKLNQENMNKILVPIPPIEEQDRIAFKVKEIYSVLSNVEKSLD